MKFEALPGKKHPPGAVVEEDGVNFALFSEDATGVELLLFEEPTDKKPVFTYVFDPEDNRSYSFWHVKVVGATAGMGYAYRVDGPDEPQNGHRFDRSKVLVDPYSRINVHGLWDRGAAVGSGDNLLKSMRSVIVGQEAFDWEGDKPINRPKQETIIYEMHVAGFTRSKTAGVRHPGTFLGVIEKVEYLKKLGITAVELLPVNAFDETEVIRRMPDGTMLKDFWGYAPIGYFALHPGYCVSDEPLEQLDEFREMVKALHRAGIEVILDMVFNHTAEGNQHGPTTSFRGLGNKVYYHLNPKNRGDYVDFSGCGNAVNANHPIVSKMIRESLEYWVAEMHVDGFRLDEGSVLSRNQHGNPEPYPRLLWEVELSEVLADTKLFTEAWDAAGLYEVGSFPGYRWSEWNGKYRDSVRRFVKGDEGQVAEMANRIAGSADIYQRGKEKPINSVNFVTCHDGFSLYDLVAYNGKHNESNGEENRDGINENLSWNCGAEGETEDEKIKKLRIRQIKNFWTVLMMSIGVPMVLSGDEAARTQRGNNNAYCQDNEISWFDWKRVEEQKDLLRFAQKMIGFRRGHGVLRRREFFSGEKNERGLKDLEWHGCRLNGPGFDNRGCRVLSMTLGAMAQGEEDVFAAFNMSEHDEKFDVPELKGRKWYMVVRTDEVSPNDFLEVPVVVEGHAVVPGRSAVVLVSR